MADPIARSKKQTTKAVVRDVTTQEVEMAQTNETTAVAVVEAAEVFEAAFGYGPETTIETTTPKATPRDRKRRTMVKVLFHVEIDLDAIEAAGEEVPGDSQLRIEVKDAATALIAGFAWGPEGASRVVLS